MQVVKAAQALFQCKADIKASGSNAVAVAALKVQERDLSDAHAAAKRARDAVVEEVKGNIVADGEGSPSVDVPSLYDYISTAQSMQQCGVGRAHLQDASAELENDEIVEQLEAHDERREQVEKRVAAAR